MGIHQACLGLASHPAVLESQNGEGDEEWEGIR